jgi:hypothetical protein
MCGGYAAAAGAQYAADGCKVIRHLKEARMRNAISKSRAALLATFALALSASATAEVSELQSVEAQAAMFKRIDEAVAAYVQQSGIDESYVGYCRTKLSMDTNAVPADGSIPFGVNYNKIATADELSTVIAARENFERSYLILCIANAKSALDQVVKAHASGPNPRSEQRPYWSWLIGAVLMAGIGFLLGRRTGSLK